MAEETTPPPRALKADFDVYLALVVSALLALGLMMVFSTTFDWSYQTEGSALTIFLKQVRSLVIGLVVAVVAWRLDYRVLHRELIEKVPVLGAIRVADILMMGTVAALGALLLLNSNEMFGAQRSLYQGSYQPGELAKLTLAIYVASWLLQKADVQENVLQARATRAHISSQAASQPRRLRFDFRYSLVAFALLVGVIGGLIVLQPDLSGAAIIVLTAWTMLFLAGGGFVELALPALGAAAVGWLLIMQFDYARERLLAHWSAASDLTQASWHVQQAIIAFTAPLHNPADPFAPNWFGRGLGQSSQKFGFLPAPHTDSIFAIIGEELGVAGCLVVIVLFVLFAWRAFVISGEAQEPFGALLAAGIGCWISYEALLNIAVLTAVIPFTGVPLPFISFGGSSLVTALAGVGLLMSISRQRRSEPRRQIADYRFGRGDGGWGVSHVSRSGRHEP